MKNNANFCWGAAAATRAFDAAAGALSLAEPHREHQQNTRSHEEHERDESGG
jgi:hypothetical protein